MRFALVALGLLVLPGGDGRVETVETVETVELVVHHSRFTPATVDVRPGTTVRFTIRNLDPIDHELIVGNDEVQRRHETGAEPHHGDRPGEVSVAAAGTATTTYRFGTAGTVPFGCHLPGHWDYGMRGVIRVR